MQECQPFGAGFQKFYLPPNVFRDPPAGSKENATCMSRFFCGVILRKAALRRQGAELCFGFAGRAAPGCVDSPQVPVDFTDGGDRVCCFRTTLYVRQPSGAAGCLRLGGSAVWLRAVFALSFGREPCSRRGFRSGACADRILVSEDCPHRLPAAGGGSKSIFRTVDGSGTLCLWKDSSLQKGRSGRTRYLSIFRMHWSAFRQSLPHQPDAPHCPSVHCCAAPRGMAAPRRQAAGRRLAVQAIYYNV